jgi:hypothetical protein
MTCSRVNFTFYLKRDYVKCVGYNLKVTHCRHIRIVSISECFIRNLLVAVINRCTMFLVSSASESLFVSVRPRAKYNNVGPEFTRLRFCFAMCDTRILKQCCIFYESAIATQIFRDPT